MTAFGDHVRLRRVTLNTQNPGDYSLRRVARQAGITPAYLSLIETGKQAPPGEKTTVRLARILREDPDVLLSLGGKVATDLQNIITRRPKLLAQLLRALENQPDEVLLELSNRVRN